MALSQVPIRATRSSSLWAGIKFFFLDRLTPSGRVLFGVAILVTAASAVTLAAKMYFVFSALAALALISLPLARMARVPLQVELRMPHSATAGATLKAAVALSNSTRRDAVDLGFRLVGLPPQMTAQPQEVGALRAGQERLLEFPVRLERRGYYQVQGVRQETVYPFGLWRDLLIHEQARTLFVYPRFSALTHLDIPVGRRYQPGGVALSSNVGDSTEFIGVRDFRSGDTIRNIHWKSWGRVGRPVVKEFQEEFFCKIALVLDTFLPTGSGETFREDFEAILSLAAAVADHLSFTEYIVDLFAAGPNLYTLESGRNLAHLDNVLDVLACLEPSYDPPFESVAPVLVEHLSTITTVILIMLDWDEARERFAQMIREYGPAIKLILVRNGKATLDPEGADSPVALLTPAEVRAGVDRL